MGAILSKVVPVTFSTIASFSRMIWRSEQTSPRKSDMKPQPFARGRTLNDYVFEFYYIMYIYRPMYIFRCAYLSKNIYIYI